MIDHTLILSTTKVAIPEGVTIDFITNLLNRGLTGIEYFGPELDNPECYIDEDMTAAAAEITSIAHGGSASAGGAKKFLPWIIAAVGLVVLFTVLKGKKPEKPPNMPAYEEKGINEDQAKALVAYMKSLKK